MGLKGPIVNLKVENKLLSDAIHHNRPKSNDQKAKRSKSKKETERPVAVSSEKLKLTLIKTSYRITRSKKMMQNIKSTLLNLIHSRTVLKTFIPCVPKKDFYDPNVYPYPHFCLTLSRFFFLGILSTHLPGCLALAPSVQKKSQSPIETLVVLSTNDLHGSLLPISLKTREPKGSSPIPYQAGGAPMLGAYVRVLQQEYRDHFLWLDAGDQFQGSLESNLEQGAPVVQFYNQMGLSASAIGNHEFDFGIEPLKLRLSEAKYPYLAANIFDQSLSKSTQTLTTLPNVLPSMLFYAGKLKVGVIGLTTTETPRTTTRGDLISRAYQFGDLKQATISQAARLRKQGAQILLVTAHVGLVCEPSSYSKVKRKATSGKLLTRFDSQDDCGADDELVVFLNSLPPGLIDGVISGHSHQIIHHWVAGFPVVQAGAFGRYFNLLYINYDGSTHKVLSDQTQIEGPVPVCEKFFQNQNDCNGERLPPVKGRGPLVPASFHGVTLKPDASVEALLKPSVERTENIKKTVLGYAARPVEREHSQESPMGNLLADSIREATHADVSLFNEGGVRSSLEEGPLDYESIFRVMPFENRVVVLKVTGAELEMILRVIENGSRGFASVSGVRLKLIDPHFSAPWKDLSQDGKSEPWKVDRLLEARLENGSLIQPKKFYSLATLDFLVMGGDDLAWPMSQIPKERIGDSSGIVAREALVHYIKNKKIINAWDQPLVNRLKPRLIFEKPHRKLKKKGLNPILKII